MHNVHVGTWVAITVVSTAQYVSIPFFLIKNRTGEMEIPSSVLLEGLHILALVLSSIGRHGTVAALLLFKDGRLACLGCDVSFLYFFLGLFVHGPTLP